MDTGAIVAVTLQAADQGDTTTLDETLCEAGEQIAEQIHARPSRAPEQTEGPFAGIEELVTDKGYHSSAVVQRMKSYEVGATAAVLAPRSRLRCSAKIAGDLFRHDAHHVRALAAQRPSRVVGVVIELASRVR